MSCLSFCAQAAQHHDALLQALLQPRALRKDPLCAGCAQPRSAPSINSQNGLRLRHLQEPGTPGAENDPAALARRLDAQKQFPAKLSRQDEANCQRQAEWPMRVLPQLEYRARFTAAEAPWSDKRLLFVSVVSSVF